MSELLARFRAAMREEHTLLEQTPPFSRLTADAPDLAAYTSFLQVMQRFYAALEAALPARLEAQGSVLEHRYHPRLPALLADLAALSLPPAPAGELALPLAHADELLAVLYVVEGSSHGARQLRGQLRSSLAGTAASFVFLDFLADWAVAGDAWENLLRQLQQRLADAAAFARIVATARATFMALRETAGH